MEGDLGRHIDHVAHRLVAVAVGHRHRDAKVTRQHRHRIVRRVGQAVLMQRQILFNRHHARGAVDRDRERRLASKRTGCDHANHHAANQLQGDRRTVGHKQTRGRIGYRQRIGRAARSRRAVRAERDRRRYQRA